MRNFLFLLASLTSYFVALPSYAVEFCNFPYSEPIAGEVAVVGQAIDSDHDRFKVLNAFKGRVVEVGGGTASLNISLSTDQNEIYSKIEQKKEGKIKIGWFSAGKSRDFTSVILKKSYSATFMLSFDATLPNDKWEIDSSGGTPLTDYAKSLVNNPCQFKQVFGNSFIFQTQRGVSLYVAITISFSQDIYFQEFKRGMNASLEGSFKGFTGNVCILCGEKKFTIPAFDFNLAFNKSSGNISQTTLESGKVDVAIMQKGGDVSRLGQVFGTGGDIAIASCSLNSLDSCTRAFNNVLAYLAQEEFAAGVKRYPVVLNYLSRPYWEIDPSITLVKEVTPAVEMARTNLATELSNREQSLITVKNMLASPSLTVVGHRQELAALQPKLEQDVQKLIAAGFTCFSDLASCEGLSNQVISNLTVYNKSILQFYPEDGLVLFLPFNTNSLDESGNGNNGVVHGAVLTKDRNGKENSAYSFNGSSYIGVPYNPQFNITPSGFSVALWFTPESSQSPIHALIDKAHGITGLNSWVVQCVNDGTTAKNLFEFAVGNGSGWMIADSTCIFDNKWHFVVVNFDGATTKFYVDGELKQTAPFSGSPVSNRNGISIGTASINNRFFKGSIDDIRIYNRAITDTEVQQLYTGKTTVVPQPEEVTATNRLGGISTRSYVGTDPANYMIAGLFVNTTAKKVVARASSVNAIKLRLRRNACAGCAGNAISDERF